MTNLTCRGWFNSMTMSTTFPPPPTFSHLGSQTPMPQCLHATSVWIEQYCTSMSSYPNCSFYDFSKAVEIRVLSKAWQCHSAKPTCWCLHCQWMTVFRVSPTTSNASRFSSSQPARKAIPSLNVAYLLNWWMGFPFPGRARDSTLGVLFHFNCSFQSPPTYVTIG